MARLGPKVSYRPQGETLARFGQSEKFVQILRGPLAGGKTFGVAFKIFKKICMQIPDAAGVRQSYWFAIRNTYPDLQTTTIKDFRAILPKGVGKFVNSHPPVQRFNFYLPDQTKVESQMVFIALDRPDHVKKLRGLNATAAWFNEMKELPQAVISQALGRCDRFPAPGASEWAGGFGDTNAWDEDHWLNNMEQKFYNGELKNWEFFVQPAAVLPDEDDGALTDMHGKGWKVNPEAENLKVLSPEYYERQIEGNKTDWIRVNLANEIGLSLDGKPVHPEYSESIHRAKEKLHATPGTMITCGLDFGLTPAAVFLQRQANGRILVLEEVVATDMGAVRFVDEIKRMTATMKARTPDLQFQFRGDPSGDNRAQTDEQTVFQVMRTNGVPAFPSSTNDVEIRRNALTRPLTRMVDGGPGIVFSPSCKILRKGLAGGFHYARVKVAGHEERFHDKPVKDFYSHVCEALEYGLMDAGEHAVVNSGNGQQFPNRPITPRGSWDVFAP